MNRSNCRGSHCISCGKTSSGTSYQLAWYHKLLSWVDTACRLCHDSLYVVGSPKQAYRSTESSSSICTPEWRQPGEQKHLQLWSARREVSEERQNCGDLPWWLTKCKNATRKLLKLRILILLRPEGQLCSFLECLINNIVFQHVVWDGIPGVTEIQKEKMSLISSKSQNS